MHRLSCAILLMCLPAATLGDPWHGIWSTDPDWCVNADRIGSVTPAPIALSATEMLGYENSCAINGASVHQGLNA